MPAELMKAPTPRDGAYAEAGRGGRILPLPRRGGSPSTPAEGLSGMPAGILAESADLGGGSRGTPGQPGRPDVPPERG